MGIKNEFPRVQIPSQVSDSRCKPRRKSRLSFLSEARRYWINFKSLPTWLAMRYLGRVIRNDPDYQEGWRANIAMPIYDRTRIHCDCHAAFTANVEHARACKSFLAPSPQLCNDIANQILKNFFDVPFTKKGVAGPNDASLPEVQGTVGDRESGLGLTSVAANASGDIRREKNPASLPTAPGVCPETPGVEFCTSCGRIHTLT